MHEENTRIKCGKGFVEIGPVCPPISSIFFPLNNEEMKKLEANVVNPPTEPNCPEIKGDIE